MAVGVGAAAGGPSPQWAVGSASIAAATRLPKAAPGAGPSQRILEHAHHVVAYRELAGLAIDWQRGVLELGRRVGVRIVDRLVEFAHDEDGGLPSASITIALGASSSPARSPASKAVDPGRIATNSPVPSRVMPIAS